MKKEENAESKRTITLHILNYRLTYYGGQGENRFGANWRVAACAVVGLPGWLILKCLPGRAGFVSK